MKYIIITSKHHDGFAMYDSGVSDYNIVDYTPFKRDPLQELSEDCAEAGLKFCVYYSHREDWEHPYAYGNFWDFDSSQTNLDTIVSKGGNYLLNVGPTGRGIIPDPSVKILNGVGDWMQKNSESIYGTSPSPFPYELGWGTCTRKGSRLFLHVFDWPENGQLSLNGLNNEIKKAYSLLDPEAALTVDRDEAGSLMIGLPAEPPDDMNSVFVLEIEGNPNIDPYVVEQDEDGSVLLDYLSASTSGKAQKRFNRRGESGHFHISKMQTPADYVAWHVQMNTPGTYHVDITYAARPGWDNVHYILEMDQERIEGTVQSTEGWYEYKTDRIGQLDVNKTGRTVVKLCPKATLDHYLMYFK